jgi:hypothetical protein
MVGLIVPAIVSFLNGWVAKSKDVANARKDGAAEEIAKVNKESTDATDRMSAANAAPRSRDIVAGSLRDGSF